MFRLALCINPDAPETAGLVQKALRSMNPEFAKDDRDRAARAARAARLRGELLEGAQIPRAAVYPGLGERWGRPSKEGIGVPVPTDSLRRLTEKIVRGIYFLEDGKFIEAPYAIDFHVLSDEGAQPVKALLDRYGREYAREPGIVVRRAVPEDEPISGIFEITVWAQFKMYSSIVQGNPNQEMEQ